MEGCLTVGRMTTTGLAIAAIATIAIGLAPAVITGVYDAALRAATALVGGS